VARNGGVSERRDAGELICVVCDSARGGTPGPRCQLLPRARTGSSRPRYGVVPRTDDQPLSDRYGPGVGPKKEHAAAAPAEPETRRGGMNRAVPAEPLTDRAPLTPMDPRASIEDADRAQPPWPHRRSGLPAATPALACCLPAASRGPEAARVGRPTNRRRRTNRSSSTPSRDSRQVGLARKASG
jgi:hypothetical protein